MIRIKYHITGKGEQSASKTINEGPDGGRKSGVCKKGAPAEETMTESNA